MPCPRWRPTCKDPSPPPPRRDHVATRFAEGWAINVLRPRSCCRLCPEPPYRQCRRTAPRADHYRRYCHDYGNQSGIIAKGVSARANITFDVKYQGGTDRNVKIPVYEKKDWAEAYDIIIHNECFGGVTDVDWVENIAITHRDTGIAAAVIHCSMHSYRNAKTDEWRKLLGVSSYSHEGHRAVTVENLAPKHPIMKTFRPSGNPEGELYKIRRSGPTPSGLAKRMARHQEGSPLHLDKHLRVACVWHHARSSQRDHATGCLPRLLRGILWACNQLTKRATPSQLRQRKNKTTNRKKWRTSAGPK